jgi:galactose mutarotase-like enzyme
MGIWKAWASDKTLGWQSPVRGPVNPQLVPLLEGSGLGWLDGFDELLVRCGLESNGAPEFDEQGKVKYPLHGRIANQPAHRVEVAVDTDAGEISVTGVVEESRFHFHKLRLTSTTTTRFEQTSLKIHDEVTNYSGVPATAQMLYHVNFGRPLLDPGASVVLPAKAVVPREPNAAANVSNWSHFAPERAGAPEHVYFFDLVGDSAGRTQALLKNAHATEGVSLRYDRKQLPCFTLWKNTPAVVDGYVTGLEPGTNFPNPRSHESKEGRVVKLESGASQAFDLEIDWHLDGQGVKKAEAAIAALMKGVETRVYDKPQPGWCAD